MDSEEVERLLVKCIEQLSSHCKFVSQDAFHVCFVVVLVVSVKGIVADGK